MNPDEWDNVDSKALLVAMHQELVQIRSILQTQVEMAHNEPEWFCKECDELVDDPQEHLERRHNSPPGLTVADVDWLYESSREH